MTQLTLICRHNGVKREELKPVPRNLHKIILKEQEKRFQTFPLFA